MLFNIVGTYNLFDLVSPFIWELASIDIDKYMQLETLH